ncbi:MutS-related protein [Jiulongibacter sediminis]|uniref:DNA mismatch repair proteins mutS family domain-containing protein n=1 Tax=Jiulongibacter sediminis TaxID=1605367 RepID=A0A0P7BLV0_9BACT|nr:hypothetical protein [Jiulongibacter sediminis]KPM48224.1 hypothetical protein AFM12_06060 [Jiulongibacter sediminis]TBX24767.1 hypothetical protein TK44_06065 [Jiulongibacter sediminis]
MKDMVEKYYEKRLAEAKEELNLLQKKVNDVSTYRLLAIVAAAVLFYFLLKTSLFITLAVGIGVLLGFYQLVKYHDSVTDQFNLQKVMLDVIENEINILNCGSSVYDGGERFENPKHRYSGDLDVFGDFSLYHKINRAKTEEGTTALARKFLESPRASDISEAQESVKELAEKDEWRQQFQASLFELKKTETEGLTGLEQPPVLKMEWLISLYPVIKWIFPLFLVAAFYFGSVTAGTICLFAFLGLHFGLSGMNKELTESYYHKLKGISRELGYYHQASLLILKENWESKVLKEAFELMPIDTGEKDPILSFQRITKKIEMKDNQLSAFFLYLFSPFDLVEMIRLRKWVNAHPDFFKRIFEAIGQFEVYTSLSTLAFNEKEWTYPEIKTGDRVAIKAKSAGHPLMKNAVCNDFDLTENNRLTLITGSNMSGKSTFLRTIGCNILLAYAGAPVFVKQFELTDQIQLFAYMRIKDSLQENASTFKAEIDRIRLLLDAMKNEPKTLILVDEMLRGTNSEDKLKGSIAFLEEVIAANAFAMVATHDLRTTEMTTKYPDSVNNFYFEYDSKDGELSFDYQLKEGVCKSFNASELLRSVGLKV